MTKEQQELYDKFVDFAMSDPDWKKWQEHMVIEELSELISAISHYRRGKIPVEELVSEIADVENMLGQIKALHNITEEEVGDERIRKVQRTINKHKLEL